MAGFCERGNETYSSIKGKEFFDLMNDYQLLAKNFSPSFSL
jgi:hypothetical protein